MPEFREILETYGADYEATLERFMGNEKLYLKILDMLFQDENLHKLGEALNSGRLADAFEAAHTLKGVAGNLGLTPLYNAVCVLVEPLRAGEQRGDYPVMYRAVEDEFKKAFELSTALKEGI